MPRRSRERPDTLLLELRIVLEGVEPPVWRGVSVAGTATLDELHRVIQIAVGWNARELGMGWVTEIPHAFEGAGNATTIDEVLRERGDRLVYLHRSWRHQVTVESVTVMKGGGAWRPRCHDGAVACPPARFESAAEYVDALLDPRQHELRTAAINAPEGFDVSETNRWLRRLTRPLGTGTLRERRPPVPPS